MQKKWEYDSSLKNIKRMTIADYFEYFKKRNIWCMVDKIANIIFF